MNISKLGHVSWFTAHIMQVKSTQKIIHSTPQLLYYIYKQYQCSTKISNFDPLCHFLQKSWKTGQKRHFFQFLVNSTYFLHLFYFMNQDLLVFEINFTNKIDGENMCCWPNIVQNCPETAIFTKIVKTMSYFTVHCTQNIDGIDTKNYSHYDLRPRIGVWKILGTNNKFENWPPLPPRNGNPSFKT